MNLVIFLLIACVVVDIRKNGATVSNCGCKSLRTCYFAMLRLLADKDETSCVEDAAIGASTVTIFLKALKQFCGNVIDIVNDHMTYEGRHLYEVILNGPPPNERTDEQGSKPVIIIEAGQQGGTESVGFALYIIEQLVACTEYSAMLDHFTWVILPCTNPDGQEYSRYSRVPWKKNLKPSEDALSYGVDLTRNFDNQFSSCPRVESGFSPIYPGPAPASENETMFIKSIIAKYKKDAKVYVSIKRDGHSIHYPYGYTKNSPANPTTLHKVAGEIAARVNQRASGVHLFINNSVFESEGKPHCGHSVDYAYDSGIPLSYEMRVFLGADNKIVTKFQTLPRGYENSLRNGYFSGIRELYNILMNEKKYGRIS
uniref:Peptidase M14 domain-containing protein n=1 Tax=Heliothis virescens TaxID=7102 RepID=A0A2A4J6G6_HELVI